jgi:hypothetical protein
VPQRLNADCGKLFKNGKKRQGTTSVVPQEVDFDPGFSRCGKSRKLVRNSEKHPEGAKARPLY